MLISDQNQWTYNALVALSRGLHFKSTQKYSELHPDPHLDLANFADKYDCVTAIRGESLRFLPERQIAAYPIKSLWTVTTIAFIMGRNEIFRAATIRLASKLTKAEIEGHVIDDAFPDEFFGKQGDTARAAVPEL